ncbi:Transmembrane protein 120-like protein [Harpegnathos saltator]|uniref:Transmembrane protein 120-like protein n=1 Tax=Harpegnathos saltator TaxID=610380 RepID=E2B7G7_HARSA|nr:Transmembrane protein 120-like protein [Harpegnathos saltator]
MLVVAMDIDAESCVKDWDDLAQDYKELEALNREYLAKLEEVGELQAKCVKGVSHQKYRMGIISKSMKNLNMNEAQEKMQKSMMRREQQLHEIEQTLPKSNGTYLQIILGNVNVSILNKSDKFKYKDEYEKFKLVLSVIGFILSVLNLFTNIRTLELSFMFLLVWYYCTLTIRESILKVNGSRIKGWWRFHHFLSTVVSGVLLVWPNTGAWYKFRGQFMWFNVYIKATWHVPVLSAMFLVLFLGNITTTIMVIPQKRRERVKDYLFASRGGNAHDKENKNEKNK